MYDLQVYATGVVILLAMLLAYRRTRDPLHPMMFLGPLFGFVYVVQPAALMHGDLLEPFFPELEILEKVETLYLVGVAAFCLGCLKSHGIRRVARWRRDTFVLSPVVSRRVFRLGMTLGILGLVAYAMTISHAGGFTKAFRFAKGGGLAASGYVGEAPLLIFPAIVLILISWQDKKPTLKRVALVLLFAVPFLVRGFLGSRRGPMFMSLCILLLPWWLIYRKRPSLKALVAGVCVVCMAVLFVWSQRSQLHLGSDFEFDKDAMVEKIFPREVDTGHEYVFGAGQVLNAMYHKKCYWGRRYLVLLFVRPIPRQIWPTKYEDVGMAHFSSGHSSYEEASEWRESLGWAPIRGAAHGLIADLFIEMSWLAILACYLIGYGFSYLWEKAVADGGLWTLLYVEASVLSIYLPSQSLTAWLYRFLFMAVPSWYLWRHHIGPWERGRRERLQREAAKGTDMPIAGTLTEKHAE